MTGLVASAVSLVRVRWFGTVCCEHVALGKHGSSSVNNSEPNQRCSDTVLLHGGHNSVFLYACRVVCALRLRGTASCLGFQTLDLMSFCTAGWVPSLLEMTKILVDFQLSACLFFLCDTSLDAAC